MKDIVRLKLNVNRLNILAYLLLKEEGKGVFKVHTYDYRLKYLNNEVCEIIEFHPDEIITGQDILDKELSIVFIDPRSNEAYRAHNIHRFEKCYNSIEDSDRYYFTLAANKKVDTNK